MEMEMRDWADLAVAMFFTHWILTIPMPIALFFVGTKKPSDLTVWMLISAWYAYSLLTPYVPGSATGSDAMIYLILPDLVPFLCLFHMRSELSLDNSIKIAKAKAEAVFCLF